MQPRLVAMEEGKDPTIPNKQTQSRVLPLRLLQFLLLFLGLGIAFSLLGMFMTRNFTLETVANTLTRPCFQEPTGSLESWIRPPSNMMHSMNDSQLLWRASFVPQIRQYPFERVRKIAFMFLTRGPLPMAPLWERFFKGHQGFYSVYVHALPSYDANYNPSSAFYKRQIPSQVAEWGRMSMCDAERRLLANALLDVSNEWFVLLSEACIPLYNFTIIYEYISRSQFSYMGAYDDPGPYGRGRYNGNMAPVVNISQWRKGSQWFEINRKLAVDIVEDDTYYPKFEQFCRPACYVDEHYFPTMLSIKSPHLLANKSITWVDWSRGGAHPATFGKVDITEQFFKKILQDQTCTYNNQTSSVCFLFARKFSPSALDPLLRHSSEFFSY